MEELLSENFFLDKINDIIDFRKFILDNIEDINLEINGKNLLSVLCRYADKINNSTKYIKLLLENGANVNSSNFYGYAPLMIVCGSNSTICTYDIAKLLIDNGSYVNAKNLSNNNALTILCYKNYDTKLLYDIAKLLIDNGADVNAKNLYGQTALTIVEYWNKNEKLICLLLEYGADISQLKDKKLANYYYRKQKCYYLLFLFKFTQKQYILNISGELQELIIISYLNLD